MNNSNSCFNLASSKYRKISLFAKYKQRHIHVTHILKYKAGMWIFLNKTRFASKILQKMTYPTVVPRTPRQWTSKNGKETLYHPIPSEKLACFYNRKPLEMSSILRNPRLEPLAYSAYPQISPCMYL